MIAEKFTNHTILQPLLQQPPHQQQSTSTPTSDIVINGSSSLITSAHFDKLKEWIPKPTQNNLRTCRFDLLYKGSRDGFTIEKFREKWYRYLVGTLSKHGILFVTMKKALNF